MKIIAFGTPDAKKQCADCKEIKPLADFVPNTNRKYGYQSYCRPCWRQRNREYKDRIADPNRKRRDGTKGVLKLNRHVPGGQLTTQQYYQMVEEQGGVCAICRQPSVGKRLSVDHDHTTNKIRGLLCQDCNLGLGRFRDNTERLQAAKEYLERAA